MDTATSIFWVFVVLGLIWLFVLVVAFVNIARREDISLAAKLLWILVILSFPILGLLLYFILGRRRIPVD